MRRHSAILLVLAPSLWITSFNRVSGEVASTGATKATVTVDAKHPWVDSGLTVHKGERLTFEADGTIQWGAKPDQVTGPEGHGAKPDKVGAGGLIGRVGFNGRPFAIGKTRTPIVMPKDGKLFLGINDFIFGDNAGAFTVTISRLGNPSGDKRELRRDRDRRHMVGTRVDARTRRVKRESGADQGTDQLIIQGMSSSRRFTFSRPESSSRDCRPH